MALLLIATTLFGGCSATICLELLIQEDPGVGHLVTLCTFLFISADGLLNEFQLGRKKLKVPGKISRAGLLCRTLETIRRVMSTIIGT